MKLERLSVRNTYRNSIHYNTELNNKENFVNLISEIKSQLLKERNLNANFIIMNLELAKFMIKQFSIKETNDLRSTKNTDSRKQCSYIGQVNGINVFIDYYLYVDGFCIGYSQKVNETNIDEGITIKLEYNLYSYKLKFQS